MTWKQVSFVALWARFSRWFEGVFVKLGGALPAPDVELPESESRALATALAPLAEKLEAQRRTTVESIDASARRWVPLVSGVPFVLVLWASGSLSGALVAAGLLGLGVFIFVQHGPAETYRIAVKEAFGGAVAEQLSGFSYTASKEADRKRLDSWRLFPALREATTEDHMTGTRDGREVALSRLRVIYARTGGRNKNDIGLEAICAEVETAQGAEGVTVLVPRNAEYHLRHAPAKTHKLAETSTGNAGFDTGYRVFSSAPEAVGNWLDPAMQARILDLGTATRGATPVLVFLPGYLATLFPLPALAQPFTPKPYWEPLETGPTLALFASDLAQKHAQLLATLQIGPNPGI